MLQRKHPDGQRRDASVPGSTGRSPGGPQVPGAGGWRIAVRQGQGWHGACTRGVADGLPQLSQVDGESIPSTYFVLV